MKNAALASALILSCASLGTAAEAAVYQAKYPPATVQSEINASLDGATYHARCMIAAARMGGKFYNNANVGDPGQEAQLLNTCKSKSTPGTAWPEGCDFGGLIEAMNAQPDFGKNWLELVFPVGVGQDPKAQQDAAIYLQIHGLKAYKSPSIAPLYGQVDHWVVIFEVETFANDALKFVRYLDACTGTDFEGNTCFDSVFAQATSVLWRNIFYSVVQGPSEFISSSDKYYNKFLTSYDPPLGLRPGAQVSPLQPVNLKDTPMPGILREGEAMAEWVAEERVWESLFLSEVDQDERTWSVLERGTPGRAWKVKAVAPSGAPWDYYLVPILDGGGSAIATVRLSAEDGAFEQLWIPEAPRFFHGISAEAAAKIAGDMVAEGEEVRGGALEWSAQVHNPHVRSPREPYYAFRAVDAVSGVDHGGILVRLSDGYAIGLERSGRAH